MEQKADILKLFEGLTPDQAKEFRDRIIPTLQEIRREIVQGKKEQARGRIIPAWLKPKQRR